MSIFLVGGGPDTVTTPVIFDQFMAEARQRAGGSRPPRIAVVLVDHGGSSEYFLPAYLEPMHSRMPSEVTTVLLHRREDADPQVFDGVDAIVVGGGPTRSTPRACGRPPPPSARRSTRALPIGASPPVP